MALAPFEEVQRGAMFGRRICKTNFRVYLSKLRRDSVGAESIGPRAND